MRSIGEWFRIEKDERPMITALSGSGFLMATAISILSSLLLAFVVKRAGLTYLPAYFVIDAMTLLLGSWIAIRFFRKVRPVRQATYFLGTAIVTTLLLALLRWGGDWVDPMSAMILASVGAVSVSAGIGLAMSRLQAAEADAFNLEQLTRLNPIFTSSITAGFAAGGALLAFVGSRGDVRILYFVIPILLALALPLVWKLRALSPGSAQNYQTETIGSSSLGSMSTATGRFLWVLAAIVAMSAMFTQLFQFAFAASINEVFTDEASMSAFIGAYMVALSLASAMLSNTVHRLTLKRFGLVSAVFIAPALIGGGVLAAVFVPIPLFVVGATFIRDAFLPLQEAAFLGMLEGLRDNRRAIALSWLDGPVAVVGTLLGAVVTTTIAVTAQNFDTVMLVRVFMSAILVLIVIRTLVNAATRRWYPEMLLESLETGDYKARVRAMESLAEYRFLREKRLSVLLDVLSNENEPPALRVQTLKTLAEVKDPSTLRVISRYIDAIDVRIRLESVKAVAAFRYQPERLYESGFSREMLIGRLRGVFPGEKSAEVTDAILSALISLRDPHIVPLLAENLQHSSTSIRHAVLRSLRVFEDPTIIDYVKPFLTASEPSLRAQAVAALWRFKWEREGSVEETLEQLLHSDDGTEERRQGIYLIGALRLSSRIEELKNALKSSSDETIKLTAAISLTKLGDDSGFEELENALKKGGVYSIEVERLDGHPAIPPQQRQRLQYIVHRHHLHYPITLSVSEPLRKHLVDIPKECIESLREHYTPSVDAEQLRKLSEAMPSPDARVRGSVVLSESLPQHWQEMATVALLANGWLVEIGNVQKVEGVGKVIIADENDGVDAADVILTEQHENLAPNQVAKGHLAPSGIIMILDAKQEV